MAAERHRIVLRPFPLRFLGRRGAIRFDGPTVTVYGERNRIVLRADASEVRLSMLGDQVKLSAGGSSQWVGVSQLSAGAVGASLGYGPAVAAAEVSSAGAFRDSDPAWQALTAWIDEHEIRRRRGREWVAYGILALAALPALVLGAAIVSIALLAPAIAGVSSPMGLGTIVAIAVTGVIGYLAIRSVHSVWRAFRLPWTGERRLFPPLPPAWRVFTAVWFAATVIAQIVQRNS